MTRSKIAMLTIAEMRTSARDGGSFFALCRLEDVARLGLPIGDCIRCGAFLFALRKPRAEHCASGGAEAPKRVHANVRFVSFFVSFLFHSFITSFVCSFISSPPNADFARFYAGFNSPVILSLLSPLLSPATVIEEFVM